ncbi:hypothetical protein AB1K18_23630 [Peribacillus simplex]|uniref:hypothetical protein n=1 Tax=Peribacillus simplex TaxID=1478 RepID=UPI003B8D1D52
MNVLADFFFLKNQWLYGFKNSWEGIWNEGTIGMGLSIEAVIFDASFVDKTVNFQYPDNADSVFNSIRYYKKIK